MPITPIPAGKIAIPALNHAGSSSSSTSTHKRKRTEHACDKCRKARSGCTGGTQCARCNANGYRCTYSDGKRDQARKEITKLQEESDQLRHLVRNLIGFNSEVMDALREIQDNPNLSLEQIRNEVEKILSTKAGAESPDEQFSSLLTPGVDLDRELDLELSDSFTSPSGPVHEARIRSFQPLSPQPEFLPNKRDGSYTERWYTAFGLDALDPGGTGNLA